MAGGQVLRFIKLKPKDSGTSIMALPAGSFIKFFEFATQAGEEMMTLPETTKIEEKISDEFIGGYIAAVNFMKNMFIDQMNKAMVNTEIAEITPGSVSEIDPSKI